MRDGFAIKKKFLPRAIISEISTLRIVILASRAINGAGVSLEVSVKHDVPYTTAN